MTKIDIAWRVLIEFKIHILCYWFSLLITRYNKLFIIFEYFRFATGKKSWIGNVEDLVKLRDMEIYGEMRESNNIIEAVMESLTQVESLLKAFRGCCGVFHTAAFVDLAGLSVYTVSVTVTFLSLINSTPCILRVGIWNL